MSNILFKQCNILYTCMYKSGIEVKTHVFLRSRKHTKARPYLCRGCGKHWRDLLVTKKHIRLHHAADYSLCYYDVSRDINNPYAS